MDFEKNVDIDSDLTWDNISSAIYDGIKDGRMSKEDVKDFFKIAQREVYEPRHCRIFVKALGWFFTRDYKDQLKESESASVCVEVDGQRYLVIENQKTEEISIKSIKEDIPDGAFVIIHETAEQANLSARERKEAYIGEIK